MTHIIITKGIHYHVVGDSVSYGLISCSTIPLVYASIYLSGVGAQVSYGHSFLVPFAFHELFYVMGH